MDIKLPLIDYRSTRVFSYCEIDDIQNMEIRDDDIWVLSHPRSGTTLTQELVYLIHTRGDFDTAKNTHLDARFPWLDMCQPDLPLFRGVKGVAEMTSPRLIKSHLHHHVLPTQLFKSKCKKIYVMRNPKDTFVSCMMMTKYMRQMDADTSQEAFLDLWLADKTYSSPWWLHVRGFWENRSDDILILHYEDIVKDMRTTVRRLCQYLGVDLTDDQVESIVSYCGFDNMKASEGSNHDWQEKHRAVDKRFGGHIRKGKVGGWRDVITGDMSSRIDKMVEERLGDLDLKFDYGKD